MLVESDSFEWMIQSTDRYEEGSSVGLTFDPEDIHVMAKSDYSPDRQSGKTDRETVPEAESEGDNW
jgi:spermidine/putrescine transport system ATP-binding protein